MAERMYQALESSHAPLLPRPASVPALRPHAGRPCARFHTLLPLDLPRALGGADVTMAQGGGGGPTAPESLFLPPSILKCHGRCVVGSWKQCVQWCMERLEPTPAFSAYHPSFGSRSFSHFIAFLQRFGNCPETARFSGVLTPH